VLLTYLILKQAHVKTIQAFKNKLCSSYTPIRVTVISTASVFSMLYRRGHDTAKEVSKDLNNLTVSNAFVILKIML
jgi:hypothetical protein